jgi:hypothetical protein
MKIVQLLSKLLAPLALALGAAAAPQLTGGGVGAWQQATPSVSVVRAQMPSDQGGTDYELLLRVHEDGGVVGQMRPVSGAGQGAFLIPPVIYKVRGQHVALPDGRVLLQAAVLLDLSQFGLEGLLNVGLIEGLLYAPAPPSDALAAHANAKPSFQHASALGVTPRVRPLPGEFVGRWVLFGA